MAKVIFREERCKGCALCVSACPKKIISMTTDRYNEKGFHVAQCTDSKECIGCAFCAAICPDVVISVEKE